MIVDKIFITDAVDGSSATMHIAPTTEVPPGIAIPDEMIIRDYIKHVMTDTIYFYWDEPFTQFDGIFNFISKFRTEYHRSDEIVILTSLDKNDPKVKALQIFDNVIITDFDPLSSEKGER